MDPSPDGARRARSRRLPLRRRPPGRRPPGLAAATVAVLAVGLLAAGCENEPQPEPPPEPADSRPEDPEPQPEDPEPEPEGASPCPSADPLALLDNDDVVKDAMARAWEDAEPGSCDAHEEGFLVFHEEVTAPDGSNTYRTVVERKPPGTREEIEFIEPRGRDSRRYVLDVHVQPGPADEPITVCSEAEADEWNERIPGANLQVGDQVPGHVYENQKPSDDDVEAVTGLGIPGAILYEKEGRPVAKLYGPPGITPANDFNGWDECPEPPGGPPSDAPPAAPPAPTPPECRGPSCGTVSGDPHLVTFDGQRYDLQAVGEFVAAEPAGPDADADVFTVQVRTRPTGTGGRVSVASAVGATAHGDAVAIHLGSPPRVNGEPVRMAAGEGRTLPGGGRLSRHGDRSPLWLLTWADGTRLGVTDYGSSLSLWLEPAPARAGRLRGILGDAGGSPSDDFRTREGSALEATPPFETLHGTYAESWRIADGESLFHYAEGESTATFTDRDYPREEASVDALPEEERRRAERICREAGVEEGPALRDCVLDVALTGDSTYARAARETRETRTPEPLALGGAGAGPGADDAEPESPAEWSLDPMAAAPHRVRYRLDGAGGREVTVSVDPPRSARLQEGSRVVFDGERLITCGAPGSRCFATPAAGGGGLAGLLPVDALDDMLEEARGRGWEQSEREIAGRRAECVSGLLSPDLPASAFRMCRDAELGAVLYFGPDDPEQAWMFGSVIEAVDVGAPRESDFEPTGEVVDAGGG